MARTLGRSPSTEPVVHSLAGRPIELWTTALGAMPSPRRPTFTASAKTQKPTTVRGESASVSGTSGVVDLEFILGRHGTVRAEREEKSHKARRFLYLIS
ncbi:hypothetical protein [Cryptosporangium sp. NPDC051539]|uniref:hypothetical protein n=1 Tax=Cryptosporangium sp. NPDC051539 TaxID=3363962 RepID=UPI0037A7D630